MTQEVIQGLICWRGGTMRPCPPVMCIQTLFVNGEVDMAHTLKRFYFETPNISDVIYFLFNL